MKMEIISLKQENTKLGERVLELETDYSELKKETSELLTNYFITETIWDAIGRNKWRLLCNIAKISLRDSIPLTKELPC